MKKIIVMFFCAALLLCILPAVAMADDGDYVTFLGNNYDKSEYDQLKAFLNTDSAFTDPDTKIKDKNGKKICGSVYSENEPYNWHGVTWGPYIEGSDMIYHVTEIDWKTSGSYYDLDGSLDLSNFTRLQSFKLNYAQIDSLSVTGDTELTTLQCSLTHIMDEDVEINKGITTLDLSTNTKLSSVNVSKNSLTSLDTSKAGTNLTELYCSENALKSLNISGNSNLKEFYCDTNEITGTLDVSNFTSLNDFVCNKNKLTGLKADDCTALTNLNCSENSITGTMGLSDSSSLNMLTCGMNKLTGLNVSGLNKLTQIDCSDNELTSLDISGDTALTNMNCSDNLITALNVDSNDKLQYLACENNKIAALSVNKNTALTDLECDGNALTSLNLDSSTALQNLHCGGNKIGSLIVSNNKDLELIDCNNCGLTSFDLSANTELTDLICYGNKLDSLNVTGNTKLQSLDCSGCGLSALDISKNPDLKFLICADNSLSALSFRDAGYSLLDISGNKFTSIDLTGVMWLFNCTNNPLSHVKASVYKNMSWTDITSMELTAGGEGYVGLYAYLVPPDMTIDGREYKNALYVQGTSKTGYMFSSWTDSSNKKVSTDSKYILSKSDDIKLTAQFKSLLAVTAVSANTAYGSVSGGGSFASGASVTLTATANKGYYFTGWYNASTLVSPDAAYTFSASGDITLTAQFKPYLMLNAESANAAYGSVSGGGSYKEGESVTFKATANTGYYFAGWYIGSTLVSPDASYTFIVSTAVTLTGKFDKIGITSSIRASSSAYNKITVSWGAVTGAKGYYVYRAASADGKYKKIGTSKKTSYVNSGVTTGVTYYYKVAAYSKSYTGSFSSVASAAAKLGQVTKVTVSSLYPTKAIIKWKAVTGAKKYQVLRSDTKDGTYRAVKTTSAKTITDTGLIPGNTYYYKVVALKGSAFGAASDNVSVTPKIAQVTGVKASRANASTMKITWKPVAGASGYEVYRSLTGADGSYVLLNSAPKYYNDATAASGITYYYIVRAYCTVNNVKYYGDYSKAVTK